MLFIITISFIFLIFAWIIFTQFTKRGRSFVFSGKVLKTYKGAQSNLKGQVYKIQVHAIQTDNERQVGLGLQGSRFGEHDMIPLLLSKEEVEKLIRDMNDALAFQEGESQEGEG